MSRNQPPVLTNQRNVIAGYGAAKRGSRINVPGGNSVKPRQRVESNHTCTKSSGRKCIGRHSRNATVNATGSRRNTDTTTECGRYANAQSAY